MECAKCGRVAVALLAHCFRSGSRIAPFLLPIRYRIRCAGAALPMRCYVLCYNVTLSAIAGATGAGEGLSRRLSMGGAAQLCKK